MSCDAHVPTRTKDDVCENVCEVSWQSVKKWSLEQWRRLNTYVRADPYIPCEGIINCKILLEEQGRGRPEHLMSPPPRKHTIFYQELLKEKSNPRLKGNRKGIIVKGKEFCNRSKFLHTVDCLSKLMKEHITRDFLLDKASRQRKVS